MPEAPWIGQWYDKYRNMYYGLTEEPKEEEVDMDEKFEELREAICDICMHKSEYKDPDDLWDHECEKCKVMDLMDKVQYADV